MRILMLTSSYPKYRGEATAPFIEEIAAGLAARGHTVDLVAPYNPDLRREPVERGVNLSFYRYAPHPTLNVWGYAQSLLGDTKFKWQTLGAIPFALLGTVKALQAQLTTSSFDLIHAHWALPNGLPAALLARKYHLPILISLHGSDIYLAEKTPPLALAARATFRLATALTACSRDLLQRSLRLGAEVEKSSVIPYGIHPQEFCPRLSARREVRVALGVREDRPLVIGLGRFVYKKGFSVLLEAWPHVLAQHPNALLVLVGYGDLREALEKQAQALGIAQQVYFTGQVDREQVATYLAAADIFALPLVQEQGTDGLPNTLLEAMAGEVPIVASKVVGVPDVIEDEVHGLLVPERQPLALAEALKRLLSDRALAARLGRAARARVSTHLTWDQTVLQYEAVYQKMLQKQTS